ncbi:MAG: IS21 family transposase, partial [Clostridia bacterium]|nr:IS21 family transposase [Clostridia bacterium]
MVNYKEILRLASEGTSQRQISVSVGHSRDTVSEFLNAAKAHNLTWPLDESVTNEQIEASPLPGASLCYQYVP